LTLAGASRYGFARVTANVLEFRETVAPGGAKDLMSFLKTTKCIVTDSHFLVPFVVLLAGITLLVVLH
jgi:hypothetical protein